MTIIPRHQDNAFQRAICERLGIDPELVSRVDANGDGEVTVYAHLPPRDLVEMFNAAGKA